MTLTLGTRITGCFLFPLILSACGGGSGGSSTPATNNSQSSSNSAVVSSSSSSSSSSSLSSVTQFSSSSASSSSMNLSPEFTLIFPNQNAKVVTGQITVRGTASDDKGITNVKVNGFLATLKPAAPTAHKMMHAKTSSTHTQVDWEANIVLPVGDTPITIEVTDNNQTTVNNSGKEIILRNLRMPIYWLNDITNNRWLGSTGELFSDKITIDKTTKKITELPHHLNIFEAQEINSDGTEIYSTDMYRSMIGNSGSIDVNSTNIATGNKTKLFNIQLEDVSPKTYWGVVNQTTFDKKNNNYYLLVEKHDPTKQEQFESMIVSVNVITGAYSTITNTIKSGLPFLNIEDLLFSGNTLYVLSTQSTPTGTQDTVYSVDLATGKLTKIADGFNILGSRIAVDDEYKYLYVVGYRDIAKVLLTDGSVKLISNDIVQSPFNFAQIRKIHIHENVLLIGDSSVGEMIAVDTQTGNRSLYLPSGIGDGLKMIAGRQLAVNAAKTIAYVLDDGGNAPERLIKVDLTNGNRTQLHQWDTSRTASALILDETNQLLFFQLEGLIGKFDLTTNDATNIYNPSYTPDGTFYIGNMVHDKANGRLLFNNQPGIISSLDLVTSTVSIAFNTSAGDEPKITNGMSLAMDTKRNQLVIKGDGAKTLVSLDLPTGKRNVIAHSCSESSSYNPIADNIHTELHYNEATDSVLLNSDFYVININLTSLNCAYKSSKNLITPLDMWPLTNDTLLVLSFSHLWAMDFTTGQSILLSR